MQSKAVTNGMVSPTRIYAGSRRVGEVTGEVFYKCLCGSKHMLRSPRGWGCDVSALMDAEAAGAVRCEFTDTETGTVYRADLASFWEHGIALDRGYGEQLCLTLEHWTVETRNVVARRSPPKPVSPQLALFAGSAE